MASQVNTVAFQGITPINICVQVHVSSATLPTFCIVGLPDKAVGESKERVRAAVSSLGLSLPSMRITVNLAPADVNKEGSHYDLAIALGLMLEMNIINASDLDRYIAIGELSLDGSIMLVSGTLPAAVHANSINKGVICPRENGSEAIWAGNNDILAADNLLQLVNHFKGVSTIVSPEINQLQETSNVYPDMKDINGQSTARRALEIAAAGGHNILMTGPPGSGKSMLASRLVGIMPELNNQEMLDVSMIRSIASGVDSIKMNKQRPFRDPHHSCSMAAMVGGGKRALPGEITLAHNGVLFLDELPEFPRSVLDALRQPLENGSIVVARANAHITYPANFQLVAAMNPCKCGYLGDPDRACNKAPRCAVEYQAKISGPFFDRIDIHIEVPPVTPADMHVQSDNESSATILSRVREARLQQIQRYGEYNISTNAQANGELLKKFSSPTIEGKNMLHEAYKKMGLSMRGYNRILRVARTIADMEKSLQIGSKHIAEALSYRQLIIKSYNATRSYTT